jgi:hypothetical protein
MTFLTDAALRAGTWLTNEVPSPTPSGYGVYTGDEDLVTPGIVGFIITFLIALATVFLVIDMVRRVRRTRYREEIREKLEAEAAAANGTPASAAPDGDRVRGILDEPDRDGSAR